MGRRRRPNQHRNRNPSRAKGSSALAQTFYRKLRVGSLFTPSCQIYIRAYKYLVRALPHGPEAAGTRETRLKRATIIPPFIAEE